MKQPLKSPIVLYVDDEEGNRVVFKHSFDKHFDLHTANSGPDAIEILEQRPVSVLITDQRMRGMTGNELLEHARNIQPDTVRIVLTAFSDSKPILEAINEGLAARYFLKPWKYETMLSDIQWALETYLIERSSSRLKERLQSSERLIALGDLSRTIFHDFRQPLAYLSTNAQKLEKLAQSAPWLEDLLKNHGHELPPAEFERLSALANFLEPIAADIIKGSDSLTQISLGAWLLGNKKKGKTFSPNPVGILRQAMAICESRALESRVKLKYEGQSDLPAVSLPESDLLRVVVNLLTNAADAYDGMGGARKPIMINSRYDDDHVKVNVVDGGRGMTKQELERAFHVFHSTKGSTGIGLSTCRRMLTEAGGDIHIASAIGQGTTATLVLPVRTSVHAP